MTKTFVTVTLWPPNRLCLTDSGLWTKQGDTGLHSGDSFRQSSFRELFAQKESLTGNPDYRARTGLIRTFQISALHEPHNRAVCSLFSLKAKQGVPVRNAG